MKLKGKGFPSYTCRVCHKDYDHHSHEPVQLPCGHVFGRRCLILMKKLEAEKCIRCKGRNSDWSAHAVENLPRLRTLIKCGNSEHQLSSGTSPIAEAVSVQNAVVLSSETLDSDQREQPSLVVKENDAGEENLLFGCSDDICLEGLNSGYNKDTSGQSNYSTELNFAFAQSRGIPVYSLIDIHEKHDKETDLFKFGFTIIIDGKIKKKELFYNIEDALQNLKKIVRAPFTRRKVLLFEQEFDCSQNVVPDETVATETKAQRLSEDCGKAGVIELQETSATTYGGRQAASYFEETSTTTYGGRQAASHSEETSADVYRSFCDMTCNDADRNKLEGFNTPSDVTKCGNDQIKIIGLLKKDEKQFSTKTEESKKTNDDEGSIGSEKGGVVTEMKEFENMISDKQIENMGGPSIYAVDELLNSFTSTINDDEKKSADDGNQVKTAEQHGAVGVLPYSYYPEGGVAADVPAGEKLRASCEQSNEASDNCKMSEMNLPAKWEIEKNTDNFMDVNELQASSVNESNIELTNEEITADEMPGGALVRGGDANVVEQQDNEEPTVEKNSEETSAVNEVREQLLSEIEMKVEELQFSGKIEGGTFVLGEATDLEGASEVINETKASDEEETTTEEAIRDSEGASNDKSDPRNRNDKSIQDYSPEEDGSSDETVKVERADEASLGETADESLSYVEQSHVDASNVEGENEEQNNAEDGDRYTCDEGAAGDILSNADSETDKIVSIAEMANESCADKTGGATKKNEDYALNFKEMTDKNVDISDAISKCPLTGTLPIIPIGERDVEDESITVELMSAILDVLAAYISIFKIANCSSNDLGESPVEGTSKVDVSSDAQVEESVPDCKKLTEKDAIFAEATADKSDIEKADECLPDVGSSCAEGIISFVEQHKELSVEEVRDRNTSKERTNSKSLNKNVGLYTGSAATTAETASNSLREASSADEEEIIEIAASDSKLVTDDKSVSDVSDAAAIFRSTAKIHETPSNEGRSETESDENLKYGNGSSTEKLSFSVHKSRDSIFTSATAGAPNQTSNGKFFSDFGKPFVADYPAMVPQLDRIADSGGGNRSTTDRSVADVTLCDTHEMSTEELSLVNIARKLLPNEKESFTDDMFDAEETSKEAAMDTKGVSDDKCLKGDGLADAMPDSDEISRIKFDHKDRTSFGLCHGDEGITNKKDISDVDKSSDSVVHDVTANVSEGDTVSVPDTTEVEGHQSELPVSEIVEETVNDERRPDESFCKTEITKELLAGEFSENKFSDEIESSSKTGFNSEELCKETVSYVEGTTEEISFSKNVGAKMEFASGGISDGLYDSRDACNNLSPGKCFSHLVELNNAPDVVGKSDVTFYSEEDSTHNVPTSGERLSNAENVRVEFILDVDVQYDKADIKEADKEMISNFEAANETCNSENVDERVYDREISTNNEADDRVTTLEASETLLQTVDTNKNKQKMQRVGKTAIQKYEITECKRENISKETSAVFKEGEVGKIESKEVTDASNVGEESQGKYVIDRMAADIYKGNIYTDGVRETGPVILKNAGASIQGTRKEGGDTVKAKNKRSRKASRFKRQKKSTNDDNNITFNVEQMQQKTSQIFPYISNIITSKSTDGKETGKPKHEKKQTNIVSATVKEDSDNYRSQRHSWIVKATTRARGIFQLQSKEEVHRMLAVVAIVVALAAVLLYALLVWHALHHHSSSG